MINLAYKQFNRDGIEIVIEIGTGAAYFSQSGYARMSGKNRTTIVKRCKGCESGTLKKAEILTAGGLQGGELIPAALAFKWAMKDNPDLALKMGECGATVYAYQLAGYQVKATETTQPQFLHILDTPDPWERMYTQEFCQKVFQWRGGYFYWDWIYHFLTPEER